MEHDDEAAFHFTLPSEVDIHYFLLIRALAFILATGMVFCNFYLNFHQIFLICYLMSSNIVICGFYL
jgi:hypothetical protein